MGAQRTIRWVFAATAALAACAVSPIPLPPNIGPELDLSGAVGGVCGSCSGRRVELRGPAAAVTHPDTTTGLSLWVVNLDGTTEPESYPLLGTDGSFVVAPFGDVGDRFRLQPRFGSVRGAPVDVLLAENGGPLVEVDHPLSSCLAVPLELDFDGAREGAVSALALRNLCGDELAVESVSLRVPTEEFRVGELPDAVPPFETVTFGVEWTGAQGSGASILFVDVRGDSSDRRFVTLHAPQ